MTTHEQESSTAKRTLGVNRRSLIRAGAHVAWTLPAVQLVTQSPAMAASGPAALTVTATNSGWTGASTTLARFTVTTTVTNSNTQPTTDLKVTYTLPVGVTAVVTPPAGWTVFSGNGSNVIVLDKIDPQLGANTSTAPFVVTFDPVDTAVGSEILVNVTATPGAPGTPGSTTTTVAASPPVLSVNTGTWSAGPGNPSRTMTFTSRTITNTGFQTTTGLRVVLTLPAGFPTLSGATAPGWTVTNITASTVTFTSDTQIGRNDTVSFQPTLTFSNGNLNNNTGTVQLVVTASNPGTTPANGTASKG